MENIKFDYVLLVILLYIIFSVCGSKVSKFQLKSGFSDYWSSLIIPIVAYSLIEGLRYNRGVDYLFYAQSYKLSTVPDYGGQPLFDWLNYGMNLLNVPYYGAFIVYSLIFIICAFIFLKEYREVSLYSFPLFLAATLVNSETFVRQFVSVAFVFLAIKAILKNDFLRFLFYSVLALLAHGSSAVILILVVVQKFFKKPINPYVAVGVYLVFGYVFDAANIAVVLPYIQKLNLGSVGSHFQSYAKNAEHFFSKDAVKDIYKQNIFTKIFNTLFDVSIIFLGHSVIKKSFGKSAAITMFYNLFIVGACLLQAFFEVELMRRFALIMYMFWFILVAYIFYYIPIQKKGLFLVKAGEVIIGLYIIGLIARYIFLTENPLFVWDI